MTEIGSVAYDGEVGTGEVRMNGSLSSGRRWINFRYDREADQYIFQNLNSFREPSQRRFETGSTIDTQLSDENYIRFRNEYTYSHTNETEIGDMWLYRYRENNALVSNSYSSFGRYREERRDGASDHLNFIDDWFIFGEDTPQVDLPQNGSTVYSGAVFGSALNPPMGRNLELAGTVRLVVDFGNRTATGYLDLSGTAADGSVVNFDRFELPQSNLGFIYANEISFDLQGTAADGGEVSTIFFGPNAEEVAAAFTIQIGLYPEVRYFLKGAILAERE